MTRRPDDCSLTSGQLAKVRQEAERALREAGALGVLPTPIDRILAVANVEEVKENVLVTTRASYRRRVRRERFEWPLGDCIPGSPWTGGSWRFGNRLRRTFGCGSTRRLSA